jgi:hypothetical protein
MTGRPAINLIGRRFGRLVVVDRAAELRQAYACWRCRCSCGGSTIAPSKHLLGGNARSCGCLGREHAQRAVKALHLAHITHGASGSVEYRCWTKMLLRCFDPRDDGGRGIDVCDRWLSFENFLVDVGKRPSPFAALRRVWGPRGRGKVYIDDRGQRR